jgi:hypothetical protein
MYQFWLGIDKKHTDELVRLIEQEGVQPRFALQKDLPGPVMDFLLIIGGLNAALGILDKVVKWYRQRRKEKPEMQLKICRYDETTLGARGDEIEGLDTKAIEQIWKEIVYGT